MADREWFQVETSSGTRAAGTEPQLPNKETAIAVAKKLAEEYPAPLTVVKYTRREIKRLQRVVTVSEEDVAEALAQADPVA